MLWFWFSRFQFQYVVTMVQCLWSWFTRKSVKRNQRNHALVMMIATLATKPRRLHARHYSSSEQVQVKPGTISEMLCGIWMEGWWELTANVTFDRIYAVFGGGTSVAEFLVAANINPSHKPSMMQDSRNQDFASNNQYGMQRLKCVHFGAKSCCENEDALAFQHEFQHVFLRCPILINEKQWHHGMQFCLLDSSTIQMHVKQPFSSQWWTLSRTWRQYSLAFGMLRGVRG